MNESDASSQLVLNKNRLICGLWGNPRSVKDQVSLVEVSATLSPTEIYRNNYNKQRTDFIFSKLSSETLTQPNLT